MSSSDDVVRYMRTHLTAQSEIRRGRRATVDELRCGHDFAEGSLTIDGQIWAAETLETPVPPHIEQLLDRVIKRGPDLPTLKKLERHFSDMHDRDAALRCVIYQACLGDHPSRLRLAGNLGTDFRRVTTAAEYHRYACAISLIYMTQSSMLDYLKTGIDLHHAARKVDDVILPAIMGTLKRNEIDPEVYGGDAEPAGDNLLAKLKGKHGGVVVIPKLPAATGSKKEVYRTLEKVAGVALPRHRTPDVREARKRLVDRWPNAIDVIDETLEEASSQSFVALTPRLFVGTPGSGKSALAVAIGEALGLPTHVIGLGGVADGALGGTSAQYHTSRPNAVLQRIIQDGLANPCFVWDEVDKASESRLNGSPFDALLGIFEGDQARRFMDPALEVEVDMSHVVHFATANYLSQVPAPLKDRMQVVEIPTPEWKHIGPQVQRIVEEIQRKKGLKPGWHQPFAQDEMDLLSAAWSRHQSFRPLIRTVSRMLRDREQLWGRA